MSLIAAGGAGWWAAVSQLPPVAIALAGGAAFVIVLWGWNGITWRAINKKVNISTDITIEDRKKSLEIVDSQDFTGKTVVLDGKHFINCTFNKTTLQIGSGDYQITACHFTRQTGNFVLSDGHLVGFLNILKALGWLRDEIHYVEFDKKALAPEEKGEK